MQTSTRLRWLAALVLWLGPLLAAHATHILGGEIMYAPIASTTAGVPRYRITTRLFRNPLNVQQPTIQLQCSRNGCSTSAAGSFTLTVVLDRTASALYTIGCTGLPFNSYQILLYNTDVDLPAGQWTFSVNETNRQADIVNIPNSVNSSFYISAYLDNTLVSQNSSPQFLSTLIPYIANVQAQRYSFSTFDRDGDSLVYQTQLPQQSFASATGCGSPVPGAFYSPHFQTNTATGALIAPTVTTQQGYCSIAVRVDEFRRVGGSWRLIGYVMRDVTYLAYPTSTNQTPRFTTLRLNGAATPQPLAQTIRVQPGQTVALDLDAADPDAGQALRFESQAPDVIPGLSLQTTGATSAKLTWQVPATLPLGRYTATVAVLDTGCPNASEEYTFSFLVAAQPLAGRASQRVEVEAFPTPFREQVQFQTSAGSQAIVIFDALGQAVAHLTSAADGRVLWQPAPTLPAGLYLARSAANGQPLARLLRAE